MSTIFTRLRRVILLADEYIEFTSEGLERRIHTLMLLAQDAIERDDPSLERSFMTQAVALIPRIHMELCESFCTFVLDEITEAFEEGRNSVKIDADFPVLLYEVLQDCAAKGIDGEYRWNILETEQGIVVRDIDLSGFDWRDLMKAGAVPDTFIDLFEKYGFHTRLITAQGMPVATALTPEQKFLRPTLASIPESVQEKLPAPGTQPPLKYDMSACMEMVNKGVDPAYIFAYQTARVFVTQEWSPLICNTFTKKWDDAVREYRSLQLPKAA